ncbi:hcalcium-binding protein [Vibrio cholerae]|nr:hcalcium-binding protein [Vibrio cholerae]WOQ97810.1 retention module-containing protein [Vibrio cholerae]
MYYQLFTARNGGSMQSQVVTQPVTVTSLSGNVVVVNAQGQARIVNAGDVLQPDEIIITVNQSAIELQTTQGGVQIDENCVACLPEFLSRWTAGSASCTRSRSNQP